MDQYPRVMPQFFGNWLTRRIAKIQIFDYGSKCLVGAFKVLDQTQVMLVSWDDHHLLRTSSGPSPGTQSGYGETFVIDMRPRLD